MPTMNSRTKNSSAGKAKAGSKKGSGGSRGRAWKQERASVTVKGEKRPRSNKYSTAGDSDKKPMPGDRTRSWVGGYTRADGKKVKGHTNGKILLPGSR